MAKTTVGRRPEERISIAATALRPSGIRKFFDLISTQENAISLGVGEPDLPVPLLVRRGAAAAVLEGNTRYTSNSGALALREAIAHYLKESISVDYCPKAEILVTAGVAQGIDLSMRAVVNPGDEVLIPEPCFVSYAPCAFLAGGRPVPVPLSASGQFKLTPELLSNCITPRSRILMLSFPNNPTGAVMTNEDWQRLIPLIERHDLTILSDEIYSELTYTGVHQSPAALPGMRNRTIVMSGFSKTFSMTGWRLGFVAGPEPMLQAMARIHQHVLMCAPTTAQVPAIDCLYAAGEIAAGVRSIYDSRRHYLYRALQDLGLSCTEPQGAFFAFPSVRSTGLSDEEFSERLLLEEKVAVIPGSAFGEAGNGYIRCSYAVAPEKLVEAVERLGRFLGRLRAE